MQKVHDIIARWKALSNRGHWDTHFQELAEQMLPGAADFTSTQAPGAKRTANIYDGTPRIAARGLVSALAGLLRPRNGLWLTVRAVDDDLNDHDEAKAWLEQATEIQRTEMYRPAARFVQATGEVDRSLVVFGTGVLHTSESNDLRSLKYRSLPLTHAYIAEDADGVVSMLYARLGLTVRQAILKFGAERLGRAVTDLERTQPDAESGLIFAVQQREERQPALMRSSDLPYAYVVVDVRSEQVVEEGGFHEFPFAVPRWDTQSGEVYGRSPGMLALPDAKTLQEQGKTNLRAGHMMVQPPMMAPSGSIVRGPYLIPGKTTYYNAKKLGNLGLRDPIRPMVTGSSLPVARDMQNDVREQIFAAFFRNVFNLPVGGPQMTATEIMERKEEFIREIGPVFGALEADYNAPLAERTFGLLLRAGKFPELPPILEGQEIRFEFASPIEKVRRQIEVAGTADAIASLAPFVEADPQIMDNFDGDEIARDLDGAGVPDRWIRSKDDVVKIREARAAAVQQQAEA